MEIDGCALIRTVVGTRDHEQEPEQHILPRKRVSDINTDVFGAG